MVRLIDDLPMLSVVMFHEYQSVMDTFTHLIFGNVCVESDWKQQGN